MHATWHALSPGRRSSGGAAALPSLTDTLIVATGGALGALARWLLSDYVQRHASPFFPWGTLAVNVLGSLLLGFVATAALHGFVSREQRLLLATGFAGAFTTFSTFSYETYMLLAEYSGAYALANILLNLGLGLLAVYLGHVAALETIKKIAP
jgi:CrcB protein